MAKDVRDGPVALMALSGARGNLDQLFQLGGVRGILTDMDMNPLEMPVWENYREGIGPLGFYLGSHGARRSICEKKLKTAPAGDLTRLMVETAYDCVVRMEDCWTRKGLVFHPYPLSGKTPFKGLPGFGARVIGRVEVETGRALDDAGAEAREAQGTAVALRSPLTCEAAKTHGQGALCAACCGWDLSTRRFPEIGLPVGILAGQSIGERGTQLTMRTFHTGGVGGDAITSGLDRVRALLSKRGTGTPCYRILDPRGSAWKKDEETDAWSLLLGCQGLAADALPRYEGVKAQTGPRPVAVSRYLGDLDKFRAIVAYEFHTIYRGAVDERHVEVLLRGMLRTEEGKVTLHGLTQAHAGKEGFLAAASFRGCLRVLAEAAKEGKRDDLRGYKERVLLGDPR